MRASPHQLRAKRLRPVRRSASGQISWPILSPSFAFDAATFDLTCRCFVRPLASGSTSRYIRLSRRSHYLAIVDRAFFEAQAGATPRAQKDSHTTEIEA